MYRIANVSSYRAILSTGSHSTSSMHPYILHCHRNIFVKTHVSQLVHIAIQTSQGVLGHGSKLDNKQQRPRSALFRAMRLI